MTNKEKSALLAIVEKYAESLGRCIEQNDYQSQNELSLRLQLLSQVAEAFGIAMEVEAVIERAEANGREKEKEARKDDKAERYSIG